MRRIKDRRRSIEEDWKRKEQMHKKWQVRARQLNSADYSGFKQLGRGAQHSLTYGITEQLIYRGKVWKDNSER